ncbi:transcriptional regulator [Nesterenkonia sp. AN1]|uniref:Putative NBD/HSP70 family sugar kinase n=1 Tax=Nesterenkonia aurantiaca TaxID=1436010 RepID=A0A4R7FWH7_9MICC|nr:MULTISPECIES: ROK family protein [Nesterenkonia]EXF24091.1 transcriptional regulator [Nesterenkonia sp. AN1]TDS83026.1 putative NBD/HSP70 family sugar kinase [Nesterenkonia aurantiaca]
MSQTPSPGPAGSSQLIRQLNAQRVLGCMWGREPSTATELMHATGLTRATVLTLCRDLTEQGWLQVSENSRQAGQYTKGRPALRYAFREDACHVIGVDAGLHQVTAAVANLRGVEIGCATRPSNPEGSEAPLQPAPERRRTILDTIDAALAQADLTHADVACLVIAVPAPVDSSGDSPKGLNAFWGLMNPELISLGAEHGWDCAVDNDANLAALAELDLGSGAAEDSFAVILSGERLGAGLVMDGSLLHQSRGGIGELGMLDLVQGVESSNGLGWWARHLAREALKQAPGHAGPLGAVTPEEVTSEHVFAAAEQGDLLALEVIDQLADRLARICVVLAGLLDLDRILVSGAIAPALTDVAARAKHKLAQYLYAPWLRIEASALGADAVRRGAIRLAVDRIKDQALPGAPGA